MTHYDALTLVDDNQLVVEIDCETCVNGSPTERCTCFNGLEYEHVDLTTLLHNLSVGGALHLAYVDGRCDGIKDGQFLAKFSPGGGP